MSVTRSAVGISPQTNANAKPTDTPAPTAAPTETPEPTDAGVPVFHTYGAPATAPASDGYQETPAPYPPAPETRTNILPQLKSGAGPGAAQVFPTVVIPSQVPPAGLGPLTTPVPGTNPVQEYIRPILRSSEFFLAGLAILAGLAALILRWTAR